MASSTPLVASLVLVLLLLLSVSHADPAQDAINKSIAAVGNSIKVAKSVSNARNKEIISTCLEVFGESIDKLKETAKALKAGKDHDAQAQASAALTDVDTCSDEFSGATPAPLKSAMDAAESSISDVLRVLK